MWRTWKDNNEDPQHMEPLLNSLQPLVFKRVRQFQGVPIQKEVLRAEANRKVIGGLRRFDPSKAQMHTFLTNELKGLSRYVQHHQNFTRVVEERANKIGDYERARSTLREQLDREPIAQEIADYMKVPLLTVTRLRSEVREDLLASGAMEDPFVEETPREREVLKLIVYELNPTEMQVFEYLTGHGGKEKVSSTSAIARRLGWSDSKVSQVKKAIADKISRYR
jgi:DNA-directed RNA polymerase specialized sigma subunit